MSIRDRLNIVGVLSAVTSAAIGLLVLIAVPAAQAGIVSCPTNIIACGCTITDANTHTLVNDISAADGLTGKGDCIDIKHANATLDGGFNDADGAGTGVGVRILPGATRASVQNFNFLDGWDIGVEDDAGSANISDNDIEDNGTAGVFLKSVNKSVVADFDADGATGSCIILKNSNNNTLSEFDASDCGVNGITATGSNRNSFNNFFAEGNTGDGVNFKNSNRNSLTSFSAAAFDDTGNGGNGVTFKNSSKNSLSFFETDDNGGDGVFIDPSSNDKVTLGDADDNSLNGIEVDKGSKFDSVIGNFARSNGDLDLLDNNAACSNGKNVWTNNCFDVDGSSPASCIPNNLDLNCLE